MKFLICQSSLTSLYHFFFRAICSLRMTLLRGKIKAHWVIDLLVHCLSRELLLLLFPLLYLHPQSLLLLSQLSLHVHLQMRIKIPCRLATIWLWQSFNMTKHRICYLKFKSCNLLSLVVICSDYSQISTSFPYVMEQNFFHCSL